MLRLCAREVTLVSLSLSIFCLCNDSLLCYGATPLTIKVNFVFSLIKQKHRNEIVETGALLLAGYIADSDF